MRRIRPHMTYANVMSTIAVFAAVAGGSAWAASQIGTDGIKDGAVTTKKLHDGAVATKKLQDGAVANAKLANASVGTDKLKDASVGTAKIRDGAVTGAKIDESSLGTVPKATIGMSPVAYAQVNANGTVNPSHSRGVTNANVANDPNRAGTFCIKGMTGIKTAIVTPAAFPPGDDGFPGAVVVRGWQPAGPTPVCDGAQFTVGTVDLRWSKAPTPYPTDLPFNVWFYN